MARTGQPGGHRAGSYDRLARMSESERTHPGNYEAPPPPPPPAPAAPAAVGDTSAQPTRRPTVLAEIRDAVTVRSFLLVICVLGLGLGFILSYVGALHHPAAKNLHFDVVAPAEIQGPVLSGFGTLPGQPLSPRLVNDEQTARTRVTSRTTTGALIVDPASTRDTLYVGRFPSVIATPMSGGSPVCRREPRSLSRSRRGTSS